MPIFPLTFAKFSGLSVIDTPSIRISPEVGGLKRLIHLRSVDFPVPEGPIMDITSPSSMTVFTSVRGIVSGKTFFICLSSIIICSLLSGSPLDFVS